MYVLNTFPWLKGLCDNWYNIGLLEPVETLVLSRPYFKWFKLYSTLENAEKNYRLTYKAMIYVSFEARSSRTYILWIKNIWRNTESRLISYNLNYSL